MNSSQSDTVVMRIHGMGYYESMIAALRSVVEERYEGKPSRLAKAAGVGTTQVQRILEGERSTWLQSFSRIADAAGIIPVRAELLHAKGQHAPAISPAPQATAPVLTFAECSIQGWAKGAPLAVRATRPSDLSDSVFAVLTVGQSMVPAGIYEGFLLFCDPASQATAGDAVYIECADGMASIKQFNGWITDDKGVTWLEVTGWLPPNAKGVQKPMTQRFLREYVTRLAPVIYVKRKL